MVEELKTCNNVFIYIYIYSNCAPRAILAVLFSLFFWHEGRAKPDSECQKNREKNQQHCPRRTYCLLHRRENTSFPAIGHEIGPKDENWRKKCLTCILFFFRQAAKKKKMRVFFSSGLAFIFPLRRENSGKNRIGRENKRSENMKFRHIAPR